MIINTAYLDPSATTALITGIASVAVALGAFAIVMVRKTKKKVSDKLGIENKEDKAAEEAIEFVEETKDEETKEEQQ